MNEHLPYRIPPSAYFRFFGRVVGVFLIAIWLMSVVWEGLPHRGLMLAGLWGQLALLFAVFAGYLIAWRHEIAGCLLSLAAIVVYCGVNMLALRIAPTAFLPFAAPPALVLTAWGLDRAYAKASLVCHKPRNRAALA
jgi:hypothetical protein